MSQTQVFRGVQSDVTTDGDWTYCSYRGTVVVKFNADTVVLNSNGWRTVTTKLRMSQAANQFQLGFIVYQEAFTWYVQTKAGTFDYCDCIEIDRATGEVRQPLN